MINIIYGEKGTGKTKQLLSEANAALETVKGSIVFIDKDNRYMYDLDKDIRFVNISEYQLDSPRSLFGFLCGLAASDFDLEHIYIDRFCRIVAGMENELDQFFDAVAAFTDKRGITVHLTYTGTMEELPPYMAPYVNK